MFAVVLVVVVVLVLLLMVLFLAFGLRMRLGAVLGFGHRPEVEEDVVPEVWADRFRAGGVGFLLPGCWNRPRGGWGRFGFGCGLVHEGSGEGRGGGGGQ